MPTLLATSACPRPLASRSCLRMRPYMTTHYARPLPNRQLGVHLFPIWKYRLARPAVVMARENDPKRRAAAWLRRQFERGVEQLTQALDDGQPDALSGLLAQRQRFRFRAQSRGGCDVAPLVGARPPRIVCDLGGVVKLLRQGSGSVLVDPGTGVLNRKGPAVGIPSVVQPPGDADSAALGVLHGVEQEVLQDAQDLGPVSLHRQLVGPFLLEEQAAIGGRRPRGRAEIAQQGGGIEGGDLALFVPRLEAGQAEQVVEHLVERGDALAENVGHFRHRLLPDLMEQRRGAFDDGDAPAQVVRRRAPSLGARALQRLQRG